MPDALPTAPESARPPEVAAPETPPPRASEGIRARDAALQIPSIVATALLTRPVKIHGITLEAFSFDAILVLNRVGNLLGRSFTPAELSGITPLELAQAVFALAKPQDAIDLAEPPNADGSFSEFDKAALRFMRENKLTRWQLTQIASVLGTLYSEGLAAAPGAGAENPPQPGAA